MLLKLGENWEKLVKWREKLVKWWEKLGKKLTNKVGKVISGKNWEMFLNPMKPSMEYFFANTRV
jgi:hypothetical protein